MRVFIQFKKNYLCRCNWNDQKGDYKSLNLKKEIVESMPIISDFLGLVTERAELHKEELMENWDSLEKTGKHKIVNLKITIK